ncbi:MAG: dCTP deaminase [Halodesulfurarchaeum sp.]
MARDIADLVSGIVYEPTQTTDSGIALTASSVYTVDDPGRVDFGGDEMESATLRPVETERRESGDDYGWWNLEAGQYLVEFNESLDETARFEETAPAGEVAPPEFLLQTRTPVRVRGAFHPTLHVTSLDPVPFVVGGDGIRLKENARVSRLTILS